MANPYGLKVGTTVCVLRLERNRTRYTEEELEGHMVAYIGRKYFTLRDIAYGTRFNLADLSECGAHQNANYLIFSDIQHFRETLEREKIRQALYNYGNGLLSARHKISAVPLEDLRAAMCLLRIAWRL